MIYNDYLTDLLYYFDSCFPESRQNNRREVNDETQTDIQFGVDMDTNTLPFPEDYSMIQKNNNSCNTLPVVEINKLWYIIKQIRIQYLQKYFEKLITNVVKDNQFEHLEIDISEETVDGD